MKTYELLKLFSDKLPDICSSIGNFSKANKNFFLQYFKHLVQCNRAVDLVYNNLYILKSFEIGHLFIIVSKM